MVFIPAALGATLLGGGLAGGAVAGIASLLSKKKDGTDAPKTPAATQTAAPAVPKIEDSKTKAVDEVKRRRSIIERTGGKTNITQGLATVPEVNVARKSLIGQ